MESKSTANDDIAKYCSNTKIDPTEFDVTICSLLIGLGAERYVGIFRKHNIGQCTLLELSEEDLEKLGIDDADIRSKIINEAKNLPIWTEDEDKVINTKADLNSLEVSEVFEESAQHMYRMYLSILANAIALKKAKNVTDCLLHEDKYASDIALSTLSEMNKILNSMEVTLHTQLKVYTKEKPKVKTKKIIVGCVGSATIVILSVLFIRSLKNL